MSAYTPATPLPWIFAPLSGIVRQAEEHGTARVCSLHVRPDAEQDGDFIAHAANAYPELVAALRRSMGALGPIADDERSEGRKGIASRACDDGQALLAKLGEET
jgi:hypothetical protein